MYGAHEAAWLPARSHASAHDRYMPEGRALGNGVFE